MHNSLLHITPSQWFIIGAIFIAFSLFTPKRIPLILTGSSLLTGFSTLVFTTLKGTNLSTPIQLAVFLITLFFGLLFIHPEKRSGILKEKDILILKSPLKKGKGIYKQGGTTYTLIGPDCPVQTKVVVVSVKAETLYVTLAGKDD